MRVKLSNLTFLLMFGSSQVCSTVYNYLGLVEKLELTNGRSIAYVFDADGQKLRKTIKETGKPDFVRFDVSMDYMGGLIYHDGKLVSIDTPEGRAVPLDSTNQDFTYQFFYNDHLGNLRVAYSVAPNGAIITQENQSSATPIAQWANYWKDLEAPKPPKGASKTIFYSKAKSVSLRGDWV